MNVVLVGPPGTGKGTQAFRLAARYDMVHLSTGDIFREEIHRKSEIGQQVEAAVKSGRLVSDEITLQVIGGRLANLSGQKGFLLDGFPRTLGQAESLSAFLKENGKTIDAVVNLQLAESEVVKRLSNRRQCDKCGQIYNILTQPPQKQDVCDRDGGTLFQRDDDKSETIRKRLMVFDDLTQPLVQFYREEGVLQNIDANAPVEDVSRKIFEALDPLAKSRAGGAGR